MNDTFLAIINPKAGGGRGRKPVAAAIARLRAGGVEVDTVETAAPGQATGLAREAYARGYRRFIAVGGDGTSYEIVNGLFPEASSGETPTLGFLPQGTGNSFLRDFSHTGVEHATDALLAGRSQPCDVLRLTHRKGALYFINLLSLGFAANVATLRHRQFSAWGQAGYLASLFLSLARLERRPFPVRVEGQKEFDQRRCLFLTFNNSKFTGGTMMIAPKADTSNGLVEYVRWGPIGRLGLIANLRTLYDGTHLQHRLAEHQATTRVEFDLDAPVDIMVDGEVQTVHCESIDVLPSALRVVV